MHFADLKCSRYYHLNFKLANVGEVIQLLIKGPSGLCVFVYLLYMQRRSTVNYC